MLTLVESQPRLTKREKRLNRQAGATSAASNQSFKLKSIVPKTETQVKTFSAYDDDKHLFLLGSAGTGKTFISLYLALKSLVNSQEYNKVIIVRSAVAGRTIGYLPGSPAEKTKVYEVPYQQICNELYGRGDAYGILKQKNMVEFMSTSYIRGITMTDAIVVVDECQNMDWGELNTIITRAGSNCRFIFCGDIKQDDLTSERYKEASGIKKFIEVIRRMNHFEFLEFTSADIVRGPLVKEYIIACEELGIWG